MWTAKLIEAKNDPNGIEGYVELSIEYSHTDNRKESIKERISDYKSVSKIIFDGIQARKYKDEMLVEKVNLLATKNLVFDFDTPKEKSFKDQYEEKRSHLMILKQDLDLGLITQSEYDVSLSAVKTIKAKL